MLASLKWFIYRHFPGIIAVKKKLSYRSYRGKPSAEIFRDVYLENRWDGDESVSGMGSSLAETAAIRDEVPRLVSDMGIRSVLDAPCGDFHWMKEVSLGAESYIGADIVPEMIAANNEKYGNEHRCFLVMDICKDEIPEADLIVSRDCFIHFSFANIFMTVRNLRKSGSAYLLTSTYPRLEKNIDIITGSWRPLNLEAAPLGFPPPLRLIHDSSQDAHGKQWSKSLGLWKIEDLPEN